MKKTLYIHIGPHKTGTTSVQEHFWANRVGYRDEGLLYPETGIAGGDWGHRHLHLANSFKPEVWDKLIEEIDQTDAPKVLLSAERFSTNLSHLADAKDLLGEFELKLIIVLRRETDLVRSRYLQLVKSYFAKPGKQPVNLVDFSSWWHRSRSRFVYGWMLQQWVNVFGDDGIIYVNYKGGPSFDIVGDMCGVLDVPVLDRFVDRNPSISASTARNAILASRFGWKVGERVMKLSRSVEKRVPSLRRASPKDFDEEEIRAYYFEQNKEALRRFPEFEKHYGEIHKSHIGRQP